MDDRRVTCVQFANGGSSCYQFRREPREFCLSTLESVAYALRFLEPDGRGHAVADSMLGVFRLMVKLQMTHIQDVRMCCCVMVCLYVCK
jgi:hypothetical protein